MSRQFRLVSGPGDGYIGYTNDGTPPNYYWRVAQSATDYTEPTAVEPFWGNKEQIAIYSFASIKSNVLFYNLQGVMHE